MKNIQAISIPLPIIGLSIETRGLSQKAISFYI
jgi:hypothetical protein